MAALATWLLRGRSADGPVSGLPGAEGVESAEDAAAARAGAATDAETAPGHVGTEAAPDATRREPRTDVVAPREEVGVDPSLLVHLEYVHPGARDWALDVHLEQATDRGGWGLAAECAPHAGDTWIGVRPDVSVAGRVVVHARPGPPGVVFEVARTKYRAGAESVTVPIRSSDWAALRVRFPRPVSGAIEGVLIAEAPWRDGQVRVMAQEPSSTVTMVMHGAGEEANAVLGTMRARNGVWQYRVDDLPVKLARGRVVDVAPWSGTGTIDLRVTGIDPVWFEEVMDPEFEIDRTDQWGEGGESAGLITSLARVAPDRWRYGSLQPGSYRCVVRLAGSGRADQRAAEFELGRGQQLEHEFEFAGWCGVIVTLPPGLGEFTYRHVDDPPEAERSAGFAAESVKFLLRKPGMYSFVFNRAPDDTVVERVVRVPPQGARLSLR